MPLDIDIDAELKKIKKPSDAQIHDIMHAVTATFDELVHNLKIVEFGLTLPSMSQENRLNLLGKIKNSIVEYQEISKSLKLVFVGYCTSDELSKEDDRMARLTELLRVSEVLSKKVM